MKNHYCLLLIFIATVLCLSPGSIWCKNASYKGKIMLHGSEPLTRMVLTTDTGSQITLEGKYVGELRHLQGMTVEISGNEEGSNYLGETIIQVDDYRILAIGDGDESVTPWVGILKVTRNNLYLQQKTKIYILNGSLVTVLNQHSNAKIWVTGTLKRGWFWNKPIISVNRFGVIAEKN